MNFLISLMDTILDHLFIGLVIGFVLFILRTSLILFCRFYTGESSIVAFITLLFIKYYTRQISKIGMQALAYSPKIDGKKITVKDAIEDSNINYVDPLILEQDHYLSGYVFNKHLHILFYKIDDLSIKGYFHDLNSNQVYIGKIKGSKND